MLDDDQSANDSPAVSLATAQEPEGNAPSAHVQQRNAGTLAEGLVSQTWQPGAKQTRKNEKLYRRVEQEKPCAFCGAMFRPYVVNERQQYCTRACYFAAPKDRSGDKNPNWKGGIAKDHMRYKLRFQAKNPEKVAAHMAVYSAKRRGDLVPQPCETCGAEKVAAHHEDYSKPLEVRWLCQPCHNKEHSGPRAHFPVRVSPSRAKGKQGPGFMWRGRWRPL